MELVARTHGANERLTRLWAGAEAGAMGAGGITLAEGIRSLVPTRQHAARSVSRTGGTRRRVPFAQSPSGSAWGVAPVVHSRPAGAPQLEAAERIGSHHRLGAPKLGGALLANAAGASVASHRQARATRCRKARNALNATR